MMKKILLIALLSIFWSCNLNAGEMNLWKKTIQLPEDIFKGHKKGWTFTNNFDPETHLTPDYAFKIVNKSDGHPVRFGNQSIRFELRRGDCGIGPGGYNDCKIWNEGNGMSSERHELGSKKHLKGITWHSFSLFLSEPFPASGHGYEHISLGQLHGYPNSNPSFKWDISRNEVYYINRRTACHLKEFLKESGSAESGEDSFKCSPGMVGNHKENLIYKKDLLGKWHDIVIHTKWSRKQDGYLKQWINGKLVYHYKGNTSKPKGSINRFKFGIYRGPTYSTPEDSTHIVYYDELREVSKSCKKLGLEDLGYSCKELESQKITKIDTPEAFFHNFIAVIKNKADKTYMLKVTGSSKKHAEKEGLKKCAEEGNKQCYVHYSAMKPQY
tara:strand:- start:644 stop:1795 length:1152 start_codon:yes stop_codon:yes gene_type:complete